MNHVKQYHKQAKSQVKKTTLAGRIRNGWRAFLGAPVSSLTLGVNVKQCKDCKPQSPPSRYFYKITYLEDIVLCVLYEATEDGRVELARGHGHIIHEGAEGVAQATSYAMRRIWNQMQR
jgi:hypothetical protein